MIKFNNEVVNFKKFPNNETYFDYNDIYVWEEGNVIEFKYEDDSDLIKLMLFKNYIDNETDDCNLIIYYMPYSRMDRSENGSPFTLKYVANFINNLNFKRVDVIEAHSNVTTALLDRSEQNLINEKLLWKVLSELKLNSNKTYIMFPDAGACSRYKNFKCPNVIIGNKNRDFETGEIKGLQLISDYRIEKKDVLIVDDLSSYGGTFVHSAKALREQGFENVYLLVAHAENSIFKGELFNHIDKVFTTDSLLTEHNYWENKRHSNKLHVFKLENLLNGGEF